MTHLIMIAAGGAAGDAAATEVAPKLMDPHLKRASLAAVYGAAELYMLTDRSPGFTDTSCFVEREVAALQQAAYERPIISVGIDADSLWFQFYHRGVFDHSGCKSDEDDVSDPLPLRQRFCIAVP